MVKKTKAKKKKAEAVVQPVIPELRIPPPIPEHERLRIQETRRIVRHISNRMYNPFITLKIRQVDWDFNELSLTIHRNSTIFQLQHYISNQLDGAVLPSEILVYHPQNNVSNNTDFQVTGDGEEGQSSSPPRPSTTVSSFNGNVCHTPSMPIWEFLGDNDPVLIADQNFPIEFPNCDLPNRTDLAQPIVPLNVWKAETVTPRPKIPLPTVILASEVLIQDRINTLWQKNQFPSYRTSSSVRQQSSRPGSLAIKSANKGVAQTLAVRSSTLQTTGIATSNNLFSQSTKQIEIYYDIKTYLSARVLTDRLSSATLPVTSKQNLPYHTQRPTSAFPHRKTTGAAVFDSKKGKIDRSFSIYTLREFPRIYGEFSYQLNTCPLLTMEVESTISSGSTIGSRPQSGRVNSVRRSN